jgi:hypothetical protein
MGDLVPFQLVSQRMPVRDLLELLRRQGEALGPNSWNGTSFLHPDRQVSNEKSRPSECKGSAIESTD